MQKHDPLASFRQPNFLLYTASRSSYTVGSAILQTVMLWQVWEISGSALNLGLLGLARLVPALGISMVGGAVADSYNRRNIIMVTQAVPFLCSIVLVTSTAGGWVTLELIYGIVALLGFAAAFEGPARQALLPSIVRPETFANAVNATATMGTLSSMSGPAIGGALIAASGVASGYAVFTALSALAIVLMALVRYRQVEAPSGRLSLEAVKEGIVFVRSHQVLLGAMTLDLFATIFGGVKALLPIFASDILKVGPGGFGLLTTAFPAGAFLMSFLLLLRPPVERSGRALILTIAAFGAGTILFGLSRDFYLSLLIFFLIGASDQVGLVMRHTTIQMATPDQLRGRVSSVNQVFTQSSNQINAFESGLVASVTNATFAVVTGGIGTLIVVATVAWRLPRLWAYRMPGAVSLGVKEAGDLDSETQEPSLVGASVDESDPPTTQPELAKPEQPARAIR